MATNDFEPTVMVGYESAQPGTHKQQFARVPPPHRVPEEIGSNRGPLVLKVLAVAVLIAAAVGYASTQIANDKENTKKAEKQDGVLTVKPVKIK